MCIRMLIKEFEAIALTESFGRLPARLLIEALCCDLLYVSSEGVLLPFEPETAILPVCASAALLRRSESGVEFNPSKPDPTQCASTTPPLHLHPTSISPQPHLHPAVT